MDSVVSSRVDRVDALSGMATEDLAVMVERLTMRYDTGTVAVDDLSLGIERGRMVGIVGPSGCGKSTLLYALAGLLQPTSGTINWAERPAGTHPLTLVFQKDTLLPWLTVHENVGMYYRFRKPPKGQRAAIHERIDGLLRLVGLEEFRDAYPYQLSGGMRRRTAFLAAVAPNPAVLLLDEPFSALDEPTRVGVQQDALQIIREEGMTGVLVTHDLAEAITMCDEVIIMTARPGRIAGRHEIPFGAERNAVTLREDPRFLSLYGTLWHDLSVQIQKSKVAQPS